MNPAEDGPHQYEMSQASTEPKPPVAKYLLEAFFLLWVILGNLLYYYQFKDLMVARFAPLLHRWH